MSILGGEHEELKPTSFFAKMSIFTLIALGLGGAVFLAVFYFGPIYSPITEAPAQPIPFSHRKHVTDNKIDCQYCHTYARRSEMSGIPAMKICMGCHSQVKTDSPFIQDLTKHYDEGKPVEWVRVYDLPDHVWFSHKRHITKDIDCSTCHGNVAGMEVVERVNTFKMGFCLKCHQDLSAPTDCWTCHT